MEDLIHIAAIAMCGGLSRQDVAAMHYVFPTLAGSVFDAMWGDLPSAGTVGGRRRRWQRGSQRVTLTP